MGRFSCGVQCTRTCFAVMNILFVVAGFTLLGFGIFLNISKKLDIALSPHLNTNILGANVLRDVGQILIVFAVFTILLSSFGCLGTCAERA